MSLVISRLKFIGKLLVVLSTLQLGWLLVASRRVYWFVPIAPSSSSSSSTSSLLFDSTRRDEREAPAGGGRHEARMIMMPTLTVNVSVTSAELVRTPAKPVRVAVQKSGESGGDARRRRLCPEIPPTLLGPIPVQVSSALSLESVSRMNPLVRPGGSWSPEASGGPGGSSGCRARQRVAVVIPFRARERHLVLLLQQLHPMLQRQQAEYTIYLVHQAGKSTFNRAKLMNVGFVEALKDAAFDCFVFSDVDLIPMNDRNLYRCLSQPQHLSVAVDKFNFRLPYKQSFGGVCAFSGDQFKKINGFSNEYWGWGGEDDDLYIRTVVKRMDIRRPSNLVGRYQMIKHKPDIHNEENSQRFSLMHWAAERLSRDGLNSLQYSLVKRTLSPLYTNLTVNIGSPSSNRLRPQIFVARNWAKRNPGQQNRRSVF